MEGFHSVAKPVESRPLLYKKLSYGWGVAIQAKTSTDHAVPKTLIL